MGKITVKNEFEVPDGLICHVGRRNCFALHDTKDVGADGRLCTYFSRYVWWSDKSGHFMKCDDCVEATRQAMQEKQPGNPGNMGTWRNG